MPTAMSVGKLARDAGNVLKCRATWGGSQNFLGASWVERTIENAPAWSRERLALRFLALSPHYFYASDVRAEDARNRRSRQVLAETLIAPHLTSHARVLDYGCGPGYLAAAVAGEAAHVDAVDISRGVLACARALNGRPNITYRTAQEFGVSGGLVDVAYSFAVIQHLRTGDLKQVLGRLAAAVRPGGVLLLHFATAENGYRTEAECLADGSLRGRVRLRYGLNCFARTPAEMLRLLTERGFTAAEVRPLNSILSMPDDDIPDQQLLTARRA